MRVDKTSFPWPIYRNRRGFRCWFQKYLEAWWAITGKYTLWHAYHHGAHEGSTNEYHRIVVMGGR